MKTALLFLFVLIFWGPTYSARAADVKVSQTMVNVAATSTVVSSRDTRRLLILQNASDTTISCKFGATAVATQGIILNPQPAASQAGGAIFFDVAVPTGVLNCIHGGSGNKAISLIEG